MGNSNTKESRSGDVVDGSTDSRRHDREPGRSRNLVSRGDIGNLLSLQTPRDRGRDRHDAPFEHRETRQEREARKLEKERATRAKERERSIREEHVDGGYLVTLGTYTGTEDFSKPVVRQLQIERKLAPFWRGLNDWSSSWAEHQLVAAARGLPIPAADTPPDPDLMPRPPPPQKDASNQHNLHGLTVPLGPRTLSAASDRSVSAVGSGAPSPTTIASPKGSSIKPRAKALAAALSVGSRNASSTDLTPKELSLPHDPFVNGQPIEVYLYKDASDCPICFLSYPPFLNRTRCCDQPICSECFVQIKRADPHLPEHHPNGETRDPNEGLNPEDPPEMLISEPSACPYCQQPEFGVTYEPPHFKRGLAYSSSSSNLGSSTAMSSQSSINSTLAPHAPKDPGRRRGHSLSATAPNVITTDRVRPDWATKLAAARAHQARRAAAATALHTAAFLVGAQENRSILRPGRFGRRNTGSSAGNEQADGAAGVAGANPNEHRNPEAGRRNRMEELEDMMFMEAVRLSLATEEERKRKEEKTLRKEAKKRLHAEKKAQKKASRDPYGGHSSGASGSSLSLGLGRRRGNSGASALRVEATVQGATQSAKSDGTHSTELDNQDDNAGKGKAVDRGPQEGGATGSSISGALPIPAGPPRGNSHLRQISNASSLGSSPTDTPCGSYTGPGGTGHDGSTSRSEGDRDNGSEPMFNFRSLAELVGVDLDNGSARQQEAAGEVAATARTRDNLDRPLSQVKEDDKEGPESEHVDVAEPGQVVNDCSANLAKETTGADGNDNDHLLPKVTVTPGTPMPDDDVAATEGKQLGHSSVTKPNSEVLQ